MKIQGKIIRTSNIVEHSDTTFHAIYKGKTIYVSSEHGLGKAYMSYLTRYNIEVTDNLTGLYDVDTYNDCHTMIDAIIHALKGACLL